MDFFFIDEVQFSVWSGLASLSDSVEVRQHFFTFFPKYGSLTRLGQPASPLQGRRSPSVATVSF